MGSVNATGICKVAAACMVFNRQYGGRMATSPYLDI